MVTHVSCPSHVSVSSACHVAVDATTAQLAVAALPGRVGAGLCCGGAGGANGTVGLVLACKGPRVPCIIVVGADGAQVHLAVDPPEACCNTAVGLCISGTHVRCCHAIGAVLAVEVVVAGVVLALCALLGNTAVVAIAVLGDACQGTDEPLGAISVGVEYAADVG